MPDGAPPPEHLHHIGLNGGQQRIGGLRTRIQMVPIPSMLISRIRLSE